MYIFLQDVLKGDENFSTSGDSNISVTTKHDLQLLTSFHNYRTLTNELTKYLNSNLADLTEIRCSNNYNVLNCNCISEPTGIKLQERIR